MQKRKNELIGLGTELLGTLVYLALLFIIPAVIAR